MQTLELILILLAVAALLQLVADKFSIPQPVLLVLGGLLLAITPGLPRAEIDPNVIFLIFIPPLLYRAALETSLRDFKENSLPITLLAVGLVLATIAAVAVVAHRLIPGFGWSSAFVLGAIVSPPDAVAVIAVTRRLGLPRDVNTILEGEGLLNDATAFVAYRMAVAAVVAGSFSIWEAGWRFLWTGAAAIALGLAFGWLIARLRRLIGQKPVVEITISLLTPFAVFIPAEKLELASVLAVVTTGLYLARKAPRYVSAETRLQAEAVWDTVVFILEGLIFIIIGLELPVVARSIGGESLATLFDETLLITGALILVRFAWIFATAYGRRFVARLAGGDNEPYPAWQNVFLGGWAGIRGGDSLVIALALPLTVQSGAPFPARDLIIVLTFAVILVTLVVQGFPLVPLLKFLNLRGDDGNEEEREEKGARRKAIRAGLERLEQSAKNDSANRKTVDRLREKYEHRLHGLEKNSSADGARYEPENIDDYRRLRLEMIAAERREMIRLRDSNEIGDETLRRIQEDLDLEEVLLSPDDEDEDNGDGAADEIRKTK